MRKHQVQNKGKWSSTEFERETGLKMPWFLPIIPENIKKRICIYLLQRYLGQFFEEKLRLDQLSIDLYNGTGTVANVSLDVQSLNELGEKQNWPLEFVDGFLEELTVFVPWASLLKESTNLEVKGLKLTLQPKQRDEGAASMFESMWSSMTSSMQLAQECMKQDQTSSAADNAQPLEGIERFAQIIDSILNRVKVKFVDTVIQFEHVPKDSNTGVALRINIDLMEYSDEAGDDPPTGESPDGYSQDQNKAYVVTSLTTKNFILKGINFSTVEFPIAARTFSRSVISMSQSMHEKDSEDSLVTILQKSQIIDGASEEEKVEEKPQTTPVKDEEDTDRHVIIFGKMCGKQEIKLRLKQSESISGPKVTIEINLSSLALFLSPRQVHVLLELANGLASPDLEDTSNVCPRSKCVEKPMTALDYERVENDLHQHLNPLSTFVPGGLQNTYGWSTGLEESEGDETFYPIKNPTVMYDSASSNISSSMESSLSSSVASSSVTEHSTRTRRKANIESDPTAEISHFQIRLSSVVAIILHEDILTVSTDNYQTLVAFSVKQMRNIAENFFATVGIFTLQKEFDSNKAIFEKACKYNHLRFLASPIQLEARETTTLTAFSVSGKLTVAKLELLECLTDGKNGMFEYIPLLKFLAANQSGSPASCKPNLNLLFKHNERSSRTGLAKKIAIKTDINVTLEPCTIDLDITIVDRINALFNPQPICVVNSPQSKIWSPPIGPQIDTRVDFKIKLPCLNINLRFPIPDFRPAHDMQKVPWWKRNVRCDFISFKLTDVSIQTDVSTHQKFQMYSLQGKTVDVIYYETEKSIPVSLVKAGIDDANADGFDYPRLVLKIYPLRKMEIELEEVEPVDLMSQSTYGVLGTHTQKHFGPFSAKKVVHESDTPHTKHSQEDSEELVIPGDKQEINNFMELAAHNSRIQIDVSLPVVSLQLVSKHIFEVIYNRINSDLLLWEPNAPKSRTPAFDLGAVHTFAQYIPEGHDTFAMCKSGIQYESDSGSDDDSNVNSSNTFYSLYESRIKQSQKLTTQSKGQNSFALNLHIGHGLLSMFTPVRDQATNVIPNQQGEFTVTVEDATIFTVSGYNGDDNLGYVCLQVANAQLHHCDMMSTPSLRPPLKEVGTALPRHLHPTIYKSDPGALVTAQNRGGIREMVTVAIKIQASHETHHVKTVKVAVGIDKGTLRHRMCHEPNTWISQLIDFFNVNDYPISGYNPKDVLTELHLHLWDCAIDYRPLNLPLRSLVSLVSFSMSSHLSAQANTSTLRFIAEECNLFLSDKARSRSGVPSFVPVDLKQDYVCVLDIGVFEMSLRTNDKQSKINPHIDLRASNNIVHIRTCSDSGRALMQLITYFAMDGDLLSVEEPTANSPFTSPRHTKPDEELVSVMPQEIRNLSEEQHRLVHDLLGEAMNELVEEKVPLKETAPLINPADCTEMFFFPDESHPILDTNHPLPQVTCELGDITYLSTQHSDTDEEFCIIEDDLYLGFMPRNGPPEINWLTSDPVRIIDNHFTIPLGKTDLLKTPKDYPTPIMKYTLCEMSLVWHMYGGSDFKPLRNENKVKKVNFADVALEQGVAYSNTGTGEVLFAGGTEKKQTEVDWYAKGGANRDHDILIELQLNKVKFQHEVYPEDTQQASRQILLVSELEIRDRLKSSQINKLLYQYTSQAQPKQTHANMITVKAVHIRPDLQLKTQECCLKVSLLPLRLNIDQDALLFLITFFSELSSNSGPDAAVPKPTSKHNTPTHQPPIMTISVEDDEEKAVQQAHKIVDENLLILLEEERKTQEKEKEKKPSSSINEDSPPIYFRSVLFSPEVPIRLDYHGKRVDMTHGSLPGLLMGLGQLNSSELRLKRLSNRHGFLGLEKLINYALQEWLNDIKKNQLPSLLSGIGPMHSLVQLCQGIIDLFWLPIEQYQKDGRIVRGLQRGANSFTTSTALAALELTSRIIHLIQVTAETAYDMVSPGPSVRKRTKTKGQKRRYTQPQDIREGVTNACLLVREGIGEAAENLVRVASLEHEQKGYSGAIGGVLREIPPTMVKPVILASKATSNVLGGVRSQLVPDARREANQKWRSDDG